MNSFNDPVYIIDFSSRHNCSIIRSAHPGQDLEVLVRLEAPAASPAIRAKAQRSCDGNLFQITLNTPDGPESITYNWQDLMETLDEHGPSAEG